MPKPWCEDDYDNGGGGGGGGRDDDAQDLLLSSLNAVFKPIVVYHIRLRPVYAQLSSLGNRT